MIGSVEKILLVELQFYFFIFKPDILTWFYSNLTLFNSSLAEFYRRHTNWPCVNGIQLGTESISLLWPGFPLQFVITSTSAKGEFLRFIHQPFATTKQFFQLCSQKEEGGRSKERREEKKSKERVNRKSGREGEEREQASGTGGRVMHFLLLVADCGALSVIINASPHLREQSLSVLLEPFINLLKLTTARKEDMKSYVLEFHNSWWSRSKLRCGEQSGPRRDQETMKYQPARKLASSNRRNW